MASLPDSVETLIVGAGLAACVNIVPGVRSVYTWEGVPQIDQEQQLLIKTTSGLVDALWDALRTRHPYEVPEIVAVRAEGVSAEYLEWARKSVE